MAVIAPLDVPAFAPAAVDEEIKPQWPGHKPYGRWEWKVSAHKAGDPAHVNYALPSTRLASEPELAAYILNTLREFESVELHHWYTGTELTFTGQADGSIAVARRQLNPVVGAPGHRRY